VCLNYISIVIIILVYIKISKLYTVGHLLLKTGITVLFLSSGGRKFRLLTYLKAAAPRVSIDHVV